MDDTVSEGMTAYYLFYLPDLYLDHSMIYTFIASRSVNMVIECIDDISDSGF